MLTSTGGGFACGVEGRTTGLSAGTGKAGVTGTMGEEGGTASVGFMGEI